MFRNGLHDGSVHDDQVLGGGLDGPALLRVARVEEQRRALQADPVALPAPLASELNLRTSGQGLIKQVQCHKSRQDD